MLKKINTKLTLLLTLAVVVMVFVSLTPSVSALEPSRTSIDFGTTQTNSSEYYSMRIDNTSAFDVTLSITGGGTHFYCLRDCAKVIPAGGTQYVTLVFRPQGKVNSLSYTNWFYVNHVGGDASTQTTITVTGRENPLSASGGSAGDGYSHYIYTIRNLGINSMNFEIPNTPSDQSNLVGWESYDCGPSENIVLGPGASITCEIWGSGNASAPCGGYSATVPATWSLTGNPSENGSTGIRVGASIPCPPPVIDGVCGSADGSLLTAFPTGSAQCSSGTYQSSWTGNDSVGNDGVYDWKCNGENSGHVDDFCSATRDFFPSVNAGSDQTITLPTTTAQPIGALEGDQGINGAVASRTWTFLGGPSTASINNPNSLSAPGFTGLDTIGTYNFQLSVTDNTGNVRTDTMSVTVEELVYYCVAFTTNALPPTITLTNTGDVDYGAKATLNLSVTDNDGGTCEFIQNQVLVGDPTYNGSPINEVIQTTVGLTGQETYTFEVECTNSSGLTTRETTVVGVRPNGPTFINLPSVVIKGGTATNVTWTAGLNATSCQGDRDFGSVVGWDGLAVAISDSHDFGPINEDSRYGIRCRNSVGWSPWTYQTVSIIEPTSSFTASPERVLKGKTSTLTWEVIGVKDNSCTILRDGAPDSSVLSAGSYEDRGGYFAFEAVPGGHESIPVETSVDYTLSCELIDDSTFGPFTVTIDAFVPAIIES